MRIITSLILILNWDTPFISPVIQMAQTQTSSTATALSSKLTDFFGAYLEKLCYQVLDSQASLNILPLFSNPMILTASTDVNMAFQGYVEDKTKSFLSSELWFPWLVYTLTPSISAYHYLTPSNLAFATETTKRIPAQKKTTENLRK